MEHDLRIPVAKWIIARGMIPICEVASLGNCDLIGVRLENRKLVDMIAIELKLSDVLGVTKQCYRHKPFVSEVFAAMPPKPGYVKEHFKGHGMGLLSVAGDECVTVLPSPRTEGLDFRRWQRVATYRRNEYIWRMLHPRMYRAESFALKCALDEAMKCQNQKS